jgi:octaprenyl-diphosphate synthase
VENTINMDIKTIRAPVEDDFKAVNSLILNSLRSDVALINEIGRHIVNSGGKRLRPVLLLLISRALGYQGTDHLTLAAVIEFIHTATLLHDDVVDESAARRGLDTANEVWGNAASVLVGDFLYSRAFQMMVNTRSMRVMEILSDTTNVIAEGEVLQLLSCHDPETTELRYFEVIRRKTAKLFEAAAWLGAILAKADEDAETAVKEYGMQMGIAFQLVDDALDYSADAETLGKNIGDDLSEGKPTLPLIYAYCQGSSAQQKLIRQAIEQGGLDDLSEIRLAIESVGAIEYTMRAAQQAAEKAKNLLDVLPNSPSKTALQALADFSVARQY